ncbi:MAG: DUF4132 domain-containing protein [Chloroflexota bacterium]|nr:DUF4132 domain-containing protein [Chloroflexota bacterium]
MLGKTTAEKIEQELRGWVEEIWEVDRDIPLSRPTRREGIDIWKDKDNIYHGALVESIERLEKKFKPEKLGTGAADLYFNPLNWLSIDEQYPLRSLKQHENHMRYVFETLIYLHPPDDLAERYINRMNRILHHPIHGGEKSTDKIQQNLNYYPPDMRDLDRILKHSGENETLVDYVNLLLSGEFNIDVNVSYIEGQPRYKKAYNAAHWFPLQTFMEYLHLHSELPYELFREALRQNINKIGGVSRSAGGWRKDRETRPGEPASGFEHDDSYLALIENYLERFADEIAADIREDNFIYLRQMNNLAGSRWLLKAAEVHSRFNLKKLAVSGPFKKYEERWESLDSLVIHLANVKGVLPEDPASYQKLIADLQAFPRETLQFLLPVAKEAREPILETLGWQPAKPLIAFILEIGSRKFGGMYGRRDVPNSPDSVSGAVNLKQYREVQEMAGEQLSREILKLFYDAKVGLDNTIRLLRAADGEGREKILKHLEKSKKRYDQKIVKAYGLLPLERGDKEVFERYLFLQEFKKDSKKAGPERQANERGAIKTALFHLAQVGGYPDVMRLEWDMESRLATEVVPVGKQWEVDEYMVELQLSGSDPDLVITRGDKRLKSVPKAVRASDPYPEIRASVEETREQARRFRSFFEDMMAVSKVITKDDLILLKRIPVPTFMLTQLILQTSEGEIGLYRPDDVSVETLEGNIIPIKETGIIAHPVHLNEAGQLADWQRLLVNRRIVQPFKQAFRELYLITPAEIETGTYSNRFAGHVVDGGVAVRLFQSRNWIFGKGDVPTPQKLFPGFGFSVHFVFPDARQYWSSDFLVTSDQIKFRAYPYKAGEYRDRHDEALVTLAEIPPTIFSEVMRDADLIVSVAQPTEKEFTSRESIQSRVELVQALIEELNLEGVSFEDQFAYVQGKLAKYRVHMGSGVIHIEPGGYLCVVPDKWGQDHKNLFLPFSDAGDTKTSEVISKIFLLLNDDKIKDQSILRQIK